MTDGIDTLDDLLTHAHALETEAVERYQELAEQMEVHNHPELADLFRKMAVIEGQHVDKVEALTGGQPRRLAPWEYQWQTPESPETVPVGQSHYRMNPHQALTLALACEERAYEFFAGITRQTTDPAVRETAARFAAEEQQHAGWLKHWLIRYGEPTADWHIDLDDPISQE